MLWSLRTKINNTGEWHNHDFHEFLICFRTGGRLETEDLSFEFREGKTILISPGVKHRFVVPKHEQADVKLICISENSDSTYMSPANLALLHKYRERPVSVANISGSDHDIRGIQELIPDDFKKEDVDDQTIAWSAVNLMLAIHNKKAISSDKRLPCKHKERINKICLWIDENISNAINIDEIAHSYGMCRSLLTREFRCYTGQSIIEYSNSRRTEKAAKILATEDYPVTTISSMIGFANLSHFHRQFKKQYRMTPAAFRKKIRGH